MPDPDLPGSDLETVLSLIKNVIDGGLSGLRKNIGRRLKDSGLNNIDGDDIYGDVLVKVFENQEAFRNHSNPRAWLCSVVRTTCIDAMRKAQRRKNQEYTAPSNNAQDPSASLENEELAQDLHKLLRQLPHQEQEALRLRFWDGLEYDDIATRLGVAVGTVRSRVCRGQQRLLQLMKENSVSMEAWLT